MTTPIKLDTQLPVQSGLQPKQVQPSESAKTQLNVSIVQSTMEVSISAKNETMRLLLKSVVVNINEAFKPYLGENAIANPATGMDASQPSQDYSPEATADRIVSLATNLLDAFKSQHPGEAQTAVVDHFLQTIKQGIDQGFKEARGILQGLGVLQGDTASNIDKTYELVQQKLNDFRSRMTAGQAA